MEFTTNEELIDGLKRKGVLKSARVIESFVHVPRNEFLPPQVPAFIDGPVKIGHLHVSAPHIYAMVLEAMKFAAGHSFLCIGSGSGYLCALVGRLVGPTGSVLGVEISNDNVEWSAKAYSNWLSNHDGNSKAPQATFLQGNCFDLDSTRTFVDRVYVGAGCNPMRKCFFRNFLRPGGILIIPTEAAFLRITRIDDTFTEEVICQVAFAPLLDPPPVDAKAPSLVFPSDYSQQQMGNHLPDIFTHSESWEGFLKANRKNRKLISMNIQLCQDGKVVGIGKVSGNDVKIIGSYTNSVQISLELNSINNNTQVLKLVGCFDKVIERIFGSWTLVNKNDQEEEKGEFLLGPTKGTTPVKLTVCFDKGHEIVALDNISTSSVTSHQLIQLACSKLGKRYNQRMALVIGGNIAPENATLASKSVLSGSTLYIVERT